MKRKISVFVLFVLFIIRPANFNAQTNDAFYQLFEPHGFNSSEHFKNIHGINNDNAFEINKNELFMQPIFENNSLIDSIVSKSFDYQRKNIYQYDSEGRITSNLLELNGRKYSKKTDTYNLYGDIKTKVLELWDGRYNGNYRIYNYSYDSKRKLTNYIVKYYDSNINEWFSEYSHKYYYDSKGKIKVILSTFSNLLNPPVIVNRETFTYDSDGNKVSHKSEHRDSTKLVNSRLETYSYNSNGNLTSKVLKIWNGQNWENFELETYLYNFYGKMISKILETGNEQNWEKSKLETYTYDSNGNLISKVSEIGNGQDWEKSSRQTYSYSLNGIRLNCIEERWDGINWYNYDMHLYSYNSLGRIVSDLIQKYSDEGKWENELRSTFNYNTDGNLTSFLYEYMVLSNWEFGTKDKDLSFVYNLQDYYFKGYSIKIYYNTLTSLQIGAPEQNHYSLKQNYPNPFNPTTQINYAIAEKGLVKIKVYDLLGKEIAILVDENQDEGAHTVNFNSNDLASGVYFYTLQSRNYVQTKKMLLIR